MLFCFEKQFYCSRDLWIGDGLSLGDDRKSVAKGSLAACSGASAIKAILSGGGERMDDSLNVATERLPFYVRWNHLVANWYLLTKYRLWIIIISTKGSSGFYQLGTLSKIFWNFGLLRSLKLNYENLELFVILEDFEIIEKVNKLKNLNSWILFYFIR